ncbi:7TM domain-containing protein [Winogradskyella sp. 3972H.M.0a.05]|uniref:7TM domain-containing protein n=1 Tax=Winogradskyella sp. 3972H.M.0a.05 TaxID=2950277 RepID=UPI00339AFD0F
MISKKMYTLTVWVFIILPLSVFIYKGVKLYGSYDKFLPQKIYEVTYQFYINPKDNKPLSLKTFIPKSNQRQKISEVHVQSDYFDFEEEHAENSRAIWRSVTSDKFSTIAYKFLYKGKAIKYELDESLLLSGYSSNSDYIASEHLIESDHLEIETLAKRLIQDKPNLKSTLKALFDYCYAIPKISVSKSTGALATLKSNKASCNGKSRLFVALARSLGISARTKGGLILENANKKTSHLWAEILVGDQWIPFDTLNGHFAFLPANFLEIYNGDEVLLTRSANSDFNYNYAIEEKTTNTYINAFYSAEFSKKVSPIWMLIEEKIISYDILKMLLLFPICGLIIAVFRNVLGIKTFGTFLSILIAFSLASTDFYIGILLFVATIGVIGLLSYVLDLWGILYTPKLTIILTFTILWILFSTLIGAYFKIEALTQFTLFPIIVLALVSQQFTRSVVEEGYLDSFKILFQTLLATTLCYVIIVSKAVESFFIVFPEMVFVVLAITLLLGKWIGLRLSEYKRFQFLIS